MNTQKYKWCMQNGSSLNCAWIQSKQLAFTKIKLKFFVLNLIEFGSFDILMSAALLIAFMRSNYWNKKTNFTITVKKRQNLVNFTTFWIYQKFLYEHIQFFISYDFWYLIKFLHIGRDQIILIIRKKNYVFIIND